MRACSTRLARPLLSSSDVPGTVTTPTTSAPSLNSGRKFRPTCDMQIALARKAAAVGAATNHGCRSDRSRTPSYSRFSSSTLQASRPEVTALHRGRRYEHSAGVTVRATAMDAASATVKETPSGRSSRPSTPERKKKGEKTSRMMKVAKTIDARTSTVASTTTVAIGRRRSVESLLFSFRRRTMFSTQMMASSTTTPMAMAMPPSVIVLMLASKMRSVSTAVSSDKGIASNVMTLGRRLMVKNTTTTTTMRPPSIRAVIVLAIDASMKLACRNRFLLITMPSGSASWISSSARSSLRVSSSVLAPGCFWTARITAGSMMGPHSWSRRDAAAVPRFTAAPTRTSPRSLTRTGTPSAMATIVPAMSSSERILPMPWMSVSWLPCARIPADTFSLARRKASATLPTVSRCAESRVGESATWYCFVSPPIGVT